MLRKSNAHVLVCLKVVIMTTIDESAEHVVKPNQRTNTLPHYSPQSYSFMPSSWLPLAGTEPLRCVKAARRWRGGGGSPNTNKIMEV